MLHAWIIIQMQFLPLIFKWKNTNKALICLNEEIYLTWGFVLKFQFLHILISQINVQHFLQAIIKGHFFIYNLS